MDLYTSDPDLRSRVGRTLRGRREQFVLQAHLCTVWQNGQYKATRDIGEVRASFEDMLRRLETDYIDVGMIHYVCLLYTSRAEETDVLRGLGLGGDDYLTKPFRVAELRARVAAHLRREARVPTRRVRRGAFDFDLASKTLYHGDAALPLTKSEYAICEYLATHAGQVFSKEQIYEAVFGYDGCADDSAVTEHVKNIRAKLKAAGGAPIETVWGIGYKWKNEEM